MPETHSRSAHSPQDVGFIRYRSTGSPVALTEALEGVRPELIRIARYQMQQREAAEDVVQATLLTAIEQAQSFDPDRRLIPWLCGILQNKIASHRRQQRRVFRDHDQERLRAPDPLVRVEEREVHSLVGKALSQLPTHYQAVLELHLNQGLGGGEIAERLHKPEGTVRAQIHRGLIRLRHILPAGLATSMIFSLRSKLGAQTAKLKTAEHAGIPFRLLLHSKVGFGLLAASLVGVMLWLQFDSLRPWNAAQRGERAEASQVGDLLSGIEEVEQARESRLDSEANSTHVLPFAEAPTGMRVRTIDHQSGQPRAHASVKVVITAKDGIRHRFELTSDESGQAEIPFDPARTLEINLVARGEKSGVARFQWDLRSNRFDESREFELRLIDARPIGGRILSSEGQPVAGAIIQLRLTEYYNNHTFRRTNAFLEARSDEQGAWSIEDAPEYPAHFAITVFHPDFVSILANDYSRSLTAERLWDGAAETFLYPGIKTSLRITDLVESSLKGAHARIVEAVDPAFYGIEMSPDASGQFSFSVDPNKPFIVMAGAPGFGKEHMLFKAERAGEDLVWKMEARHDHRVRLLDHLGNPMAGALVRPFIHSWAESLTSDREGFVTLAMRSENWVLIQIERPGVMGYVNRLVYPGDESIQMPRPVDFELLVMDAHSGFPLADYEATVYHPGRWRRGRVMGSKDGEAKLIRFHPEPFVPKRIAPERPVLVLVEHPGYEPFVSEILHTEAFPARVIAELVPAKSLSLNLLDPEGNRARQTRVLVATGDQRAILLNGQLSAKSNERKLTQFVETGEVTITRPPGTHALFAVNAEGYARVSNQELNALGESAEIRLQAWGCVEGSSSSDATIHLCSSGSGALEFQYLYTAKPTPDGRFHFCQVPAGNSRLSIEGDPGRVSLDVISGSVAGPFVLQSHSSKALH